MKLLIDTAHSKLLSGRILLSFLTIFVPLSRSRAGSTPDVNVPTDNNAPEIQSQGLSGNFMQWVDEGEAFWY
jgi:hypothetical protein